MRLVLATCLWLVLSTAGMAQQSAAPDAGARAPVLASQAPAVHGGAIPFKRESGAADAGTPAGAFVMLLVAGLAIGAVLVLRKRLNLAPATAGKGLVRVLETQRLGPRTLLSVVEFSGQRYLVAQGDHGVNCLASAPAPGDRA